MRKARRPGPPRTGETVICVTCQSELYKKRSRILRDRLHFCSNACRVAAISANKIDRKFDQAAQKKRNGVFFLCCICGRKKYQKRSYFNRGVNKTCGDPRCVSAYGRSLWGLPPYSDEERDLKRKRPMEARETNFTASQRANWIDSECASCGTSDNLCLDHVIPVCAGGTSSRKNSQTLCQPCNIQKLKDFDLPYSKATNGLS